MIPLSVHPSSRMKFSNILTSEASRAEATFAREADSDRREDGFLSENYSKGAETFSIVDVQLKSDGKEAAKIIRECVTGAPYESPAGTTGPLTSVEIDSPVWFSAF